MKLRKKIIPPRLLGYFKFNNQFKHLNNNLYYNTQIFNGFSFFSILIIICFLFGFSRPIFWSTGLACAILLLFLYQKTLKICQGLSIERLTSKHARERSEISVQYKISNTTGFSMQGMSFTDEFTGLSSGCFKVESIKTVDSQTQVNIIQKVRLNSGMGIKEFGVLRFSIRDELGIFDFKLEFSQTQEIEVFPNIEETPVLKNSISPESIDFGFYEIAKRGDSNLFIGTREYRRGDPIKHINWKLSKKRNQTVVNEYEKSTNAYVTLLLELNLDNQSGLGEHSTWEMAKDLGLSFCYNEIKKNNSIQVIANNLYIPFDTGTRQIQLFEKHFTSHQLKSSSSDSYSRHLSSLPAGGQVYFICPIHFSLDTLETIEKLKWLKAQGMDVMIFAIDPFQGMAVSTQGQTKLSLLERQRISQVESKNLTEKLKSYGIPLIIIQTERKHKLKDQLVKQCLDRIEIK